mmetsp:Transcript_27189/g.55446  ORF Transcript_27189/g.55446 Transcript_27189/m.55446 type:complete len:200 (-) Transcript_27189:647-1246(-)
MHSHGTWRIARLKEVPYQRIWRSCTIVKEQIHMLETGTFEDPLIVRVLVIQANHRRDPYFLENTCVQRRCMCSFVRPGIFLVRSSESYKFRVHSVHVSIPRIVIEVIGLKIELRNRKPTHFDCLLQTSKTVEHGKLKCWRQPCGVTKGDNGAFVDAREKANCRLRRESVLKYQIRTKQESRIGHSFEVIGAIVNEVSVL